MTKTIWKKRPMASSIQRLVLGWRATLAVLAALVTLGAAPAFAQLHVDIDQGHLNPMPIAAPDFLGADAA